MFDFWAPEIYWVEGKNMENRDLIWKISWRIQKIEYRPFWSNILKGGGADDGEADEEDVSLKEIK